MDFWNKKDLPSPPVATHKASTKDIDLKHFYNMCLETKLYFDNNQYMNAEYLVLSRTIYRMKQKFRSSKDFKVVEKVCKMLKTFFETNITSHLDTLIDLIPAKYRKETYLPSKNLLDFILVKLQGLAKLLEKIIEDCKQSASLLYTHIKIGHFWKIRFLVYSIISRIYTVSKHSLIKVCEFYSKLIPFSTKLQSKGKWLPGDYKLPTDLKEWLNIDWLESDEDIQLIDITKDVSIIPLFDLVDNDDDDIEFCDEYILINDQDEDTNNELKGFEINDDIGEIVDVNSNSFNAINVINNANKSRKRKKKKLREHKENPDSIEIDDKLDNIDVIEKGFESNDDIGELVDVNSNSFKAINEINNANKSRKRKKKKIKEHKENPISVVIDDIQDTIDVIELSDSSFNNDKSSGDFIKLKTKNGIHKNNKKNRILQNTIKANSKRINFDLNEKNIGNKLNILEKHKTGFKKKTKNKKRKLNCL